MNRFNFPFSYIPKLDQHKTLLYISEFKKLLIQYIQKKYECVEIVAPAVSYLKESIATKTVDQRSIFFDDKNTANIFQTCNYSDNYLVKISDKLKDFNLFCFYSSINRDANLTNLNSLNNWQINVDFYTLLENHNVDYLSQLIQEVYNDILKICQDEKLESIYKIDLFQKQHEFDIVQGQTIENKYPTFSLEEAFNHYCSTKQFTILQDPFKKLNSNQSIKQGYIQSQDFSCASGLYAYDNVNNNHINLITTCSRPSGQIVHDQILKFDPSAYDNNLYDHSLYNKSRRQNINITIHFSNLLFYLLDKIHLAEIIPSVWDDDFLQFVKFEKIEIM